MAILSVTGSFSYSRSCGYFRLFSHVSPVEPFNRKTVTHGWVEVLTSRYHRCWIFCSFFKQTRSAQKSGVASFFSGGKKSVQCGENHYKSIISSSFSTRKLKRRSAQQYRIPGRHVINVCSLFRQRKGVWTGNLVSAITFRKMYSNCFDDLIGIISSLEIECSRRPGI